MATKPYWVKWNPKDALDGMATLDPWEELAYRRIIDLIYTTHDNLPDNDRKMAWMTKTGKRWPMVKEGLIAAGKIALIDGRIVNEKCSVILGQCDTVLGQRAHAGQVSAGKRKSLKYHEMASTGVDDVLSSRCNENATSVSTTSESEDRSKKEGTETPGNTSTDSGAPSGAGGEEIYPWEQPAKAPPKPATEYAFLGRVVHLTHADFDKWRKRYHAITDFEAELTLADDYYTQNPPKGGNWFFAVSSWLKRSHDKAVQDRSAVQAKRNRYNDPDVL